MPNLVLMNKGQFRDAVIRKFQSIGYRNVTFLKVCASDFGVPQDRHRIIFVGTRDDEPLGVNLYAWCEAYLDRLRLPRPFTVWEAISDLPPAVVPSGETMNGFMSASTAPGLGITPKMDVLGKPVVVVE